MFTVSVSCPEASISHLSSPSSDSYVLPQHLSLSLSLAFLRGSGVNVLFRAEH